MELLVLKWFKIATDFVVNTKWCKSGTNLVLSTKKSHFEIPNGFFILKRFKNGSKFVFSTKKVQSWHQNRF